MRSEGLDSDIARGDGTCRKIDPDRGGLADQRRWWGIDITALSVFGGAFAVGLGFGLKTKTIMLPASRSCSTARSVSATSSPSMRRLPAR